MSEHPKDNESSSEHGNDGRRRLVRGAVSLAPLVLTLRSGALAASSCTGVVAFGNITNSSGKIENLSSAIQSGQVCVSSPTSCESQPKISRGVYRGIVSENGQNFTCGNGSTGPVAILSSASASSLGIGPVG